MLFVTEMTRESVCVPVIMIMTEWMSSFPNYSPITQETIAAVAVAAGAAVAVVMPSPSLYMCVFAAQCLQWNVGDWSVHYHHRLCFSIVVAATTTLLAVALKTVWQLTVHAGRFLVMLITNLAKSFLHSFQYLYTCPIQVTLHNFTSTPFCRPKTNSFVISNCRLSKR